MSLIELTDVSRTVQIPDADPLTILSGVSLAVDPGERLSVVGRSGSGKSTLLNILGLLDLPTTGDVTFDGESVPAMRSGRRDRIRGSNVGFVFQQFNLLDGRTALENVTMPLLYATGPTFWGRERIAAEMLDRVGLSHRLAALPGSLSGGEQQRVAIARALVRGPRLILADEPTGALDVETGQSVMELLDDIVREENAALVTITHDPAIAARSNRHFRLDAGHLAVASEVVA
ncbi:ABC transporter ATP-binding protein [Mycetocola sp. 2940]|uniref:ABC transporter ATP-binding protein n=1 Tax=Mycetocola sp. 2940 TaxID=3156452 RepID=UPI003393B9A5